MTDKQTQSIVAKIIGAGAAFVAALVVQKVLALAWKAKTGHKPPAADDQGDAGLAEVVAAAAHHRGARRDVPGAGHPRHRAVHGTVDDGPDLNPTN